MAARVFAFDPGAFSGASGAIDVAREIVTGATEDVAYAAGRVLACAADDPHHVRAALFAQVIDALATEMTAVQELLRVVEDDPVAGPILIHGVGPIRLTLMGSNGTAPTAALLAADQVDALTVAGLALSPACSVLGIAALPLPADARVAASAGETTLAVACALLAAIPSGLAADAARRPLASGNIEFGSRLYRAIFPGAAPVLGMDLLWRDALVLALRAVAPFDEWRETAARYQSSAGDEGASRSLVASVVERVASARAWG